MSMLVDTLATHTRALRQRGPTSLWISRERTLHFSTGTLADANLHLVTVYSSLVLPTITISPSVRCPNTPTIALPSAISDWILPRYKVYALQVNFKTCLLELTRTNIALSCICLTSTTSLVYIMSKRSTLLWSPS